MVASTNRDVFLPNGSRGFFKEKTSRTAGIDFLHTEDDPISGLENTSYVLPHWIEHSRTSPAMMFDSSGLLVYAPGNLLTFSNAFTDNTVWKVANSNTGVLPVANADYSVDDSLVTDEDGIYTATQLYFNLGSATPVNATSIFHQNVVSSTPVLGSFWIKTADGGAANLFFTLDGSNYTLINASSTWTQFYLKSNTAVDFRLGLASNDVVTTVNTSVTANVLIMKTQLEPVTHQEVPGDYIYTADTPAHLPRYNYGLESNTLSGLLIESAHTNICLHSRNLSNSAWVANAVTVTNDQTGIDGVPNSAYSIAANSANGFILQDITVASGDWITSVYVKRVLGEGNVYITQDGGLTWTYIALDESAAWQRFQTPVQTFANPSVGFMIEAEDDQIAVDCVQTEADIVHLPIITSTATVVVNADILTVNTSYDESTQNAIVQYFSTYDRDGNGVVEHERILLAPVTEISNTYVVDSHIEKLVMFSNDATEYFLLGKLDMGTYL